MLAQRTGFVNNCYHQTSCETDVNLAVISDNSKDLLHSRSLSNDHHHHLAIISDDSKDLFHSRSLSTIIIIIIIIINIKDWTSLIRSVSRVTTVLANVSSVFGLRIPILQLYVHPIVCCNIINKTNKPPSMQLNLYLL